MENKKSKMLIIIFALIIITLIGIILVLVFKNSSVLEKKNDTDKEVSMKENSTNTSKENKVDDEKDKEEVIKVSEICGVYRQETESEDEEVDNVIDELQLYENGMFHFTHAERTEPGCIGNYYIEDNKIILNVLFEHGSDAALYIVGEVYELEIDEEGWVSIRQFLEAFRWEERWKDICESDLLKMIVNAKTAWNDGIKFYLGNENVWLADAIPGRYIEVPPI